MNLGGRAAFAVPLIAVSIGLVAAILSVAMATDDAVIKGWDIVRVTFFFATIIAMLVGFVFSFPAVLFGHLLPKPRLGWLIGVGAVTASVPVYVTSGTGNGEAMSAAIFFGALGAFAACLWWYLVERHREEDRI